MTAGSKKSEHDPCPVCGKPRGKGPYEFSHGPCYEHLAKTEGRESAGLPGDLSRLSKNHVRKGRANDVAKRYLSGKNLPYWMFS